MSDLPSVFSSEKPIQDENITFVIDTNILIEFESIAQIDWRLVCPNAMSINIVVPSMVVREMDRHKKGTGRILRRALDFNKILLEIEDGNGLDIKLQSDHVDLHLMLMPRYTQEDLHHGKLSLEVADDLIVAETVKFTQEHPDAIFLADDNNARRTAREMDINVARPAEEWRRKEPKDPRDARIEELERQLGAIPELSLELLMGGTNTVTFQTLDPKAIPDAFCDRVANLILERNPCYSRDELLERHNLPTTQKPSLFSTYNPYSVSVNDVDKYCHDYRKFKERVIAWSRRFPELLNKIDFVAPIHLKISNEGYAFAEHVEVSVSASNGYGFISNDIVRSYLELGCKPPDPPSKDSYLSPVSSFLKQRGLPQKDPFEFYFGDAPDQEHLTSDISYVCERFRHGSRAVLSSALFKENNAPSGGLLTVRASSASLADPVEVRYPIRVKQEQRSEDFKAYLRSQLFFFPEEVRDSISTALKDF